MAAPKIRFLAALCASWLVAHAAHSDQILLTTQTDSELQGLLFLNGDVITYDLVSSSVTVSFDESVFEKNENVDAVHRLSNGNLLLSTSTNAKIGNVSIGKDDIFEYDFATGTASIVFDGSALFDGNENVDAVSILPNGNLAISTTGKATLGGLSFENGDVVEYDLTLDSATLLFDESLFSSNQNISAFAILGDGSYLISTNATATLGGLTFGAEDVIAYDPVGDSSTLYFDGSGIVSGGVPNVWGVSIPEPGALPLTALGLLALNLQRRRA